MLRLRLEFGFTLSTPDFLIPYCHFSIRNPIPMHSGDSLQSAHCNISWESYPRILLPSHKRKSNKDTNPDRLNPTKTTSEYMKSKKAVAVHNRINNRLSLFVP